MLNKVLQQQKQEWDSKTLSTEDKWLSLFEIFKNAVVTFKNIFN